MQSSIIKIAVSILLFLLIGCKSSIEATDYFGQNYPDSIPIIFAPGIVSMEGRLEHGISFTPDTRELAFGVLNKDNFNGEIFYSKKISTKWTEPSVFEPLRNKSVYLPYFSPDGTSILYAQSKVEKENVYTDIWMLEKINGAWSSPKLVPAPISSSSREANASMTYNGTMYFSSTRRCDGKKDCYTADLFCSKLNNNQYQSASVIPELISPNDEESVFISPKEDYIVFCRYTGEETGVDLYISYRDINDKWTEPRIADSTINSTDWDRRPFVSIDNNFLFFTRLKIEASGIAESDIYWVNTGKLFKPFVYHPLSDIKLQQGKHFEIFVPHDYFKNIDSSRLIYSVNVGQSEWIKFDSEQMKISGVASAKGDYEITLTATDRFANRTNHKLKLIVD
ncbi:hypothetical protein ORI89_04495 [Sphingobacterium sp. UT-1RO-CII-1]|uniref:putative Ig domain-containing protein n=1 Tax=Sphingobacterium sp. UT-1RO-CII-1 TaxID=2995225 RepID=UPI00227A1D66|nr:putative Ig domain-containing protein [Sphingobacterium sp. UT-1RO-CII-1]MCY4778897.1 hypothetical protein [Sphingobacterium sp. UT-1RO-CII-1]